MTRALDALALLSALAGRGVEFVADGDRLRFRPVTGVSLDEKDQLRDLKGEVILLLKARDPALEALCSSQPPEEAQALREERAAIMEYGAGMTRAEAERRAGLLVEPIWNLTHNWTPKINT